MTIALQCSCGHLQGTLEPRDAYARVVCYCRDCQAYARLLGREDVLDACGGSDIVAMQPAGLRFTAGADRLTCLSLSPRGPLRWHSACCNTPLANTARDPRLPYAGVLVACITADPSATDRAFGPARVAVNTGSATRAVRPTRRHTAAAVCRIGAGVLLAKLRHRHRDTPFFIAGTSRPVVEPRIVARAEREAATPADHG
ncbi:hypothetical protein CO641_07810 [Lysobacteraceae bacterium NML91-0213]|nr:hypothetical protein CO641_07810 [Xanthomonadaceae bacterium NML91-0213]